MLDKLVNAKYSPEIELATYDATRTSGGPIVMAPHFESYIDPVILGQYVPGSPLIVVSKSAAMHDGFQRHAELFRHEIVDIADPASVRELVAIIEREKHVVIFPEIDPTSDGVLSRVSDAVVEAIVETKALVVPAAVKNTRYTEYSRLAERCRPHHPPKVKIFSGEADRIDGEGDLRLARVKLERMIEDTMMESIYDKKPLFDTILEQRDIWGSNRVMAMEPDGTTLTWREMIAKIELFAGIITGHTGDGDTVGIMLPNSSTTLAMILASQKSGRVPAMINYSMGPRALLAACSVASVKRVYTSKRFIAAGKLDPLIEALVGADVKVSYLEEEISAQHASVHAKAASSATFAKPSEDPLKEAERTALILFTSGSEGTPKAVALSHLNIQANTAQVRVAIPFVATDVIVAELPMFHSYGLCTGVFVAMSTGTPIAFFPSPLQYKKIPQYITSVRGSILLGTNAFLSWYAKSADAFDFPDLRLVVCGGDKLRASTNKLWIDKFGIRIREGYGVTECSPVLSVNKHGRYKFGTVGQPLPGVKTRLEPVEGVVGAGRLIATGPNIMKGYLQADGSIIPVPESGYDTGDICSIDDEGFITIQGRAKRFAKIGAEMVSLAYVEEVVSEIWPDETHAVVSIHAEDRGEMIVMLTERANADRNALLASLKERGVPELAMPKRVIKVDAVPRIGSGKIDYQAAAKAAAEAK